MARSRYPRVFGSPAARAQSRAVFAATDGLIALLPVNSALPAITGTVQEGQILSVSNGSWSNNPTSYSYQWRRGGVAIAGSINASRTLTSADVGAAMSCVVTATNAAGSTPAATANTVAVIAASVPVPVNTVAPAVTGTGTVGQVLATDNGTWSNSPTSYAYAWRRDGVDISGATSQTYKLVDADAGKAITCRVFATNGGGTAGSTSNSLTVAAAAAAMRALTGTYTGTGTAQDVALPFVPDIVYVWGAGQPLVWRGHASWHGRTQRFHTAPSSYVLNAGVADEQFTPFNKSQFGVSSGQSVNGQTYSFLALKKNGTNTAEEISIVGNALDGRTVDFTSRRSAAIIGKRDSSRSAVFVNDGGIPARADPADGPLPNGIAVTASGMTLSNSVWVNENNNIALGEAIEYVSLAQQDGFIVQRRTGTGGAVVLTGFGKAAFVLDASRSGSGTATPPQAVIDGRPGARFDGAAPANAITLSGGTLTLPAEFNAAGVDYLVLSFADNPSSPNVDVAVAPVATTVGRITESRGILSSGFSLSGACSYEFYGRATGFSGVGNMQPLIMFGAGTDQASNGMNGGAYLYTTDPDSNGWVGPVIRIITSNYLARNRTAPNASINYYNLNTGIAVDPRAILHLVVTHDGNGKWRVFLNGELVKEHSLNLNQSAYGNRINGGEGTSQPVYVLGTLDYPRSGEIYRAQVWTAALSDAEARSLFVNARDGAAWAGTVPALAKDFRNQLPAGTTNIAQAAKATVSDRFWYSATFAASWAIPSYSGSDVVVTTPTGNTNGRVYTHIGSGTFSVRSVIDYGNATRIIARTSTAIVGDTGTAVFDVTGTGTIDRTDTLTGDNLNLFYIGITAAGQSFTIKAATTITRTGN